MLPVQEVELIDDIELITEPSLTYQFDLERYQLPSILVDGKAALAQAIYKILMTERYQYPIYSWNYGFELQDLYGKPFDYVIPELKRRIREALMQDDRITEVDSFRFEKQERNSLLVTFLVHSIYGEVGTTREVKL